MILLFFSLCFYGSDTTQMMPPHSGFPKSIHLKFVRDPISPCTYQLNPPRGHNAPIASYIFLPKSVLCL